jgi:hypothetical protein
MQHIDVNTVLRQTIACDLYSNLVTRPTGAAVRVQIERMLSTSEPALAIIDLTHVSMLDFSCADEVVAKLLLRFAEANAPHDAYFLFRGVTEDHWEAIETVLHRRGLALVIEREDELRLAGVVEESERKTWEAVCRVGPADAYQVACELGDSTDEVARALETLWRRRLVMKVGSVYMAVGKARE